MGQHRPVLTYHNRSDNKPGIVQEDPFPFFIGKVLALQLPFIDLFLLPDKVRRLQSRFQQYFIEFTGGQQIVEVFPDIDPAGSGLQVFQTFPAFFASRIMIDCDHGCGNNIIYRQTPSDRLL